jgi:hypothetical protein
MLVPILVHVDTFLFAKKRLLGISFLSIKKIVIVVVIVRTQMSKSSV